MTPLRIFIGWDSRETVAWHVLAHSLISRASVPTALIPLRQDTLRAAKLYWRDPDEQAATEFSLTRFLVPYLMDYRGVGVFLDCDILARVDIAQLVEPFMLGDHRECPDEAVWVVKHDYTPRAAVKFNGATQHAYPRKNWSSVIVFNAERCQRLTLPYVNTASPADLHRFAWTENYRIGALHPAWNYLVDEDGQSQESRCLIHYTNGTPCWPKYAACAHASEWWRELDSALAPLKL